MKLSKESHSPDAIQLKADSVAGSPAESMLREINAALVSTTLSQRQEFFHRLADDAAKTLSHRLPGLEIDDSSKTHAVIIRDTLSGDIVYGETQLDDNRRRIFEMHGYGSETTTTLAPDGKVQESMERHRYTDTNVFIGREDTYRNVAGEVTGRDTEVTMVGGERRSYRTDAYGNLISQSTGRTDGSYDIRDYDKFHNGNYTETFVDAKGQSQSVHIDASSPWQPRIEQAPAMPGGVMILGKVVDRSQTLDAFLEKIKERQNRGAVDGHGSTASRNKSPESTN